MKALLDIAAMVVVVISLGTIAMMGNSKRHNYCQGKKKGTTDKTCGYSMANTEGK
jgi:hypothetical protein